MTTDPHRLYRALFASRSQIEDEFWSIVDSIPPRRRWWPIRLLSFIFLRKEAR